MQLFFIAMTVKELLDGELCVFMMKKTNFGNIPVL